MNGDKVTRIELTCENCRNNDDGLCGRLGILVEPDEKACTDKWEPKEEQT